MSELDGTRTISIPLLVFNYVDNRLESIGTCGELYYRERGAHAPHAGTRWHDLFGTPERAARTLKRMCVSMESCTYCPLYASGVDFCESDEGDGVVEWLEGADE